MSDIEALKAEKATLIAEMLELQKQFMDIEHQKRYFRQRLLLLARRPAEGLPRELFAESNARRRDSRTRSSVRQPDPEAPG